MARDVHRREDLLRDATALVPRIMLRLADGTEVFAGFRGPSASVYFGEDPVYHFSAAGELRRAYIAGRLIKADEGRLIAMTRRESATETTLERRELSADQERDLLKDVGERLRELRALIACGGATVVGEVSDDGAALVQLATWLEGTTREIVVARRANVT